MKILLWLVPLALVACTAPSDPNPSPATPAPDSAPVSTTTLSEHHWQLREAVDGDSHHLDGLFDTSGKPLQLDFTDDRVNVRNACNNINGGYKIVDGHLVTELLMQTMMACADPVLMERETTIKNVLQGQPSVVVSTGEDTPLLVLSAPDGMTLSFAGQPTAQTRYGSPGTVEFLEIAAQAAPCDHPPQPDATCLKARELQYDANGVRVGEPGPWQNMAEPIEGYEHQPGVRNVLRVKRYTVPNPPADASSVAYVLDMVVESETVDPSDAPSQ